LEKSVSDQKLVRNAHNCTPRHTTVFTGLPLPGVSGHFRPKSPQEEDDMPNQHGLSTFAMTPCDPSIVVPTDDLAALPQRLTATPRITALRRHARRNQGSRHGPSA